jgi:hypothetical protein
MAAKKKARKRAAKKKAPSSAPKRANPLTATLGTKREFSVDRGAVYLITLRGDGGREVELGHVTADTQAAAGIKARAYLRKLL